jgi:MoaA/NifB/PqqE/SkfB family radical SAM enzyme
MNTFPGLVAFGLSAALSALLKKRVLNCLWELTYRCNARCAICDYWRRSPDPSRELDTAAIRSGLDKIFAHGCRVINFTGGEPLLRDDLEAIVGHASRLGMWTSVVTNGNLMTQERMIALREAGLDNLFLSLDSIHPEAHDRHRGVDGLFARTEQCARWLSRSFLKGHRTGGFMCVLTKANIREAEDLVRFAHDRGVFVVFQPYHALKTGSGAHHADLDDEVIRRIAALGQDLGCLLNSKSYLEGFAAFATRPSNHCRAGQKYFSVDPYGGLHPCVEMPAQGHLLRDDFAVLVSRAARECVGRCPGCWYCFRGEADTSISWGGCLEKIGMGAKVIRHNLERHAQDVAGPEPEHAAASIPGASLDRLEVQ